MEKQTGVKKNSWREALALYVESRRVQRGIIILISLNAVILGFETSSAVMDSAGDLLVILDRVMLMIFVVEITVRIIAHGGKFFRDPWSVFDFIVVSIALLPATGQLSVLRALRVLRTLRLLSSVSQMRQVISALLAAIPGISSVVVILALLYYVFSVIATNLFGGHFPLWFGNIGRSMYSLFQIMTLESWSMGIVRPVMEVYPYAWAFFVPYILIVTFTMLNLFIAIIVSAMQSEHKTEHGETKEAVTHAADEIISTIHSDIRDIRLEIRELKALIKR